jgi:hypothetical protein
MQRDSSVSPERDKNHSRSKVYHRFIARWFRWLHIYLSMLSLGSIFFFSITGLTLNHPDWFFRETTSQKTGKLDLAWLNQKNAPPADWKESDYGHEIDKLSVVEHLRHAHKLSGRVSDFLSFSDECEVTFQGPGYAATARIQRNTGDYNVSITCNDLVSILNDLHKGRNTGPLWSLVIDVSAIVSAIVALSGFVLVFYLKLNRKTRLAISVLGVLLVLLAVRIAMTG